MGLSAALPLGSLYNMSKFALEGLTEGLYAELKPLNIDLHLVEPGGFSSDFGENTTFVEDDPTGDYGGITRKGGDMMKASQSPGALPDPGLIVNVIYDLATGKKNVLTRRFT
jgi:NAD(P)-dependent dehydrogenase (short-subunit alcohol dehydrogenase family)